MKQESKKIITTQNASILGLLLIAGICMFLWLGLPSNMLKANANEYEQMESMDFAENNNYLFSNKGTDLTYSDFLYLSGIERVHREEFPNIAPEEMTRYLDSKIDILLTQKQGMFSMYSSGGDTYRIFGKDVTSAEIALSIQYPAQAIMAMNASTDAAPKGQSLYETDRFVQWLGNGDAFRHAYWNALMEKRISKTHYVNIGTYDFPWYVAIQVDFPKLFADAHEYGRTGIDTQMDLANNALGRGDGATYGNLSDNELANQIMKRVSRGHYNKIINAVIDSKDYVTSGNLVSSDWIGLRSENISTAFYDTTDLSNNNIRIDSFGVKGNFTGSLDVPSTINGRTVTAIANSAFQNAQLSQISIPASVTHIGESAFNNCSSLTNISIPASVTHIGSNAFLDTGIMNKAGSNSVVYAGNWAVGYKGTLSGVVTLSPGTVGIADYALANCAELTSVVIPNSLKYISTGAVENNKLQGVVNVSGKYNESYGIPASGSLSKWFSFPNSGTVTVSIKGSNQSLTVYYADGTEKASAYTNSNIKLEVVSGELYRFSFTNHYSVARTVEIEINASPVLHDMDPYNYYNLIEIEDNGSAERYIYFLTPGTKMIQFFGSENASITVGHYINYEQDVYGYWESTLRGSEYGNEYLLFNPYHGSMTGLIKITVNDFGGGDSVKILVWDTTAEVVFLGDFYIFANYENTGLMGYHRSNIYVLYYTGDYISIMFSEEWNISCDGTLYIYNVFTGEIYYYSGNDPGYTGYLSGSESCYIVFFADAGLWCLIT